MNQVATLEPRPSVAAWALCGAVLGLVLALPILLIGNGGEEASEGAAILGGIVGAPASLLLMLVPMLTRLSRWIPFVLLALTLNGILLGGTLGAVGRRLRWSSRWWLLTIPTTWLASALVTGWAAKSF